MARAALITGSSGGIGADIALKLSQNGFKVFLTGRNESRLIEQAKKCSAIGYMAGDLSDDNFLELLFRSAKDKFGQIDILINNAGSYVWSPVEKTDKSKIDEIFRLNLQVPYKLCRLAVSDMKFNKWGRIVNIGSISGIVGEANASLYSASKAGLIGLTKALALELAEHNITVNLVNPGWVKTEMVEPLFTDGILDEAEQMDMIPQRRWIEPCEISALVNYLASEDARGITGQSINLCAGLSLG
ncbi:MAG: SDR family NAD(P)-dependent oxidoreductase [Candidatus Gastranaerophilales bacterium]|nr:SDR family NAD(P)-dependent oxidoreductase [Candidatus Gastranaerophilales bacterium]